MLTPFPYLKEMRVGILGGTFNPIHYGHLKIAQAALKKLKLDHVLFIPVYRPPHRRVDGLAAPKHRLEMVRRAVEPYPRFLVSTVEMERRGKSYSVDTLRRLRKIYRKGTRFFFIIGSDSLYELYSWKKIAELSKLCEFVALIREGHPVRRLKALELKLPPAVFRRVTRHRLAIRPVRVSGTEIRARVRSGKRIKGLVPSEVEEYIKKQKLYRR